MIALGDIAEIRSGSVPRVGREGVAYLQARHIRGEGLVLDDVVRGSRPIRAAERARISEGDVLINSRGTVNHAVAVGAMTVEAYASLDLLLVRPDLARLRADYLAAYLNLPSTQLTLGSERTTALLPRLSLESLAALQVPLPSLERQLAIAGLAAAAREERALVELLLVKRRRLIEESIRGAAEHAPIQTRAAHRRHERRSFE